MERKVIIVLQYIFGFIGISLVFPLIIISVIFQGKINEYCMKIVYWVEKVFKHYIFDRYHLHNNVEEDYFVIRKRDL